MKTLKRRLAREDAGLGLVEMLIAMLLTGILLALVATLFLNVARATGQSNLTREAATVAGNIANQIGKTVRFAVQNPVEGTTVLDPAIVDATASALTILSAADADAATLAPARVRYSISGDQVVEERWSAADDDGFWVFGGVAAPPRTLGGTVVAPAAGEPPLFRYLDAAGVELMPGATGLTAAQRERVASVALSLRIRSASSADAPVTVVESTIGMPNLTLTGVGS